MVPLPATMRHPRDELTRSGLLRSLGLSAVLHGAALAAVLVLAAHTGAPPHAPQPLQAALMAGLAAEAAPNSGDAPAWSIVELDAPPWPTPHDDEAARLPAGDAASDDVLEPPPEPEAAPHSPALAAPPAPSLEALRREAARRRAARTPPPAAPARSAAAHAAPPPARTPAQAAAPLQVVHTPDPDRYYPQAARRAHIEGRVLVRITIDPSGVVSHASVERSSGSRMLDDAALALARAYRFSSAAHARVARLPVVFELGPLFAARR